MDVVGRFCLKLAFIFKVLERNDHLYVGFGIEFEEEWEGEYKEAVADGFSQCSFIGVRVVVKELLSSVEYWISEGYEA